MIKTIHSLLAPDKGGPDRSACPGSRAGNIKAGGKAMSAPGILHPHNPEFDRFLQASVGEDRNGNTVTVLSTLARLDLEPWDEAAALSALGQEAAGSRLEKLLSRFRDVPALRQQHGHVARKLTSLLPKRRQRIAVISGAATKEPAKVSGVIWAVLAILFLVMQIMLAGAPGSGQ
ncbi:hypothetical protein [Phaeobacter inhibens]|uniref:hypothetical protein n=2 Tax=Phaeobacter inhibens TaxID=221822 RepID=UPI000F49CC9B|nr:hypothetical protein [Phaeobacter inhibens]MDO6756122.1 hypothetical protein [Phaeobacter inhibens]